MIYTQFRVSLNKTHLFRYSYWWRLHERTKLRCSKFFHTSIQSSLIFWSAKFLMNSSCKLLIISCLATLKSNYRLQYLYREASLGSQRFTFCVWSAVFTKMFSSHLNLKVVKPSSLGLGRWRFRGFHIYATKDLCRMFVFYASWCLVWQFSRLSRLPIMHLTRSCVVLGN